jgi:hypothetical protein
VGTLRPMVSGEALRRYNAAGDMYLQALEQAWARDRIERPSLWLARDPESQDKMLRDATIGRAVQHRCSQVAGRSHLIVPSDPADPRGEIACAVMENLLKGIKKFAESRKILARAFFHGQRFARIHGSIRRLDIGDGVWRNWWVPVRLEDQSEFRYRKRVDDAYAENPRVYWERRELLGPAKGKWVRVQDDEALEIICHTFEDSEATLGYGSGLREQLGHPWYCLSHVNQEQLGAIERFARGWAVAKIDRAANADTGHPNSSVMAAWERKLQQMQGRHVLVLAKDDEIEIVRGSWEGWQMMEGYIDRQERRVDRLVNAAQLPTGGAADTGSLARAEVEESSTEALYASDRVSLEETLDDDLLECIWRKNWPNIVALGLQRSRPGITIVRETKDDPEKLVVVMQGAHGMGMDLAADDSYERLGLKKPDPGEEVIPGQSGVGMGGFPFGGGLNEGGLLGPEQDAETSPAREGAGQEG